MHAGFFPQARIEYKSGAFTIDSQWKLVGFFLCRPFSPGTSALLNMSEITFVLPMNLIDELCIGSEWNCSKK